MRRFLILLLFAGLLAVPATSQAASYGYPLSGPFGLVNFDQDGWGNYGYPKDTMSSLGCGPTALAIIVATFKRDAGVTPAVIAKKFYEKYHPKGSGSWATMPEAVGNYYHLGVWRLGNGRQAFRQAKQILMDGGLVLGLTHRHPIAVNGHYFVIRALTGAGRYLIADPNPRHNGLESRMWHWYEMLKQGPAHPMGRSTQFDQLWGFLPTV